ncbi:hypothetical protein TMU01_09820 [Tenuibacillus multivorans]|nr:hypothetical protein TMU01_09820 [Tenuibacillus multivorans]
MPSLENEPEIRENMAFGTYQFMTNLKRVLEDGEDLRPTFWKSWLGFSHSSVRVEKGSKVRGIKEGTPAEKAGIDKGDVITGVNGKQVESFQDLERMITTSEVGEILTLTIDRNGTEGDVRCETVPYPVEYRKKVEW